MTGFSKIAYTAAVRAQQHAHGSADAIARSARDDRFDALSDAERHFIARRDEFYLATVNADGWPYVQYKSGKPGFVTVDAPGTALCYTEIPGNRQFVSFGNIAENSHVSLFFIDYAHRMRLKLYGLARLHQQVRDTRIERVVPGQRLLTQHGAVGRIELRE